MGAPCLDFQTWESTKLNPDALAPAQADREIQTLTKDIFERVDFAWMLNGDPLILSHGWPWTFWDYHKIIGPLSDPARYGGDSRDAFDVIDGGWAAIQPHSRWKRRL